MSRFNTPSHKAKPAVATVSSPLGTTSQRTRTFEGATAWVKNDKTDLFLRASASFHDGGNTFYESGDQRDTKLRELAQKVAVEDFTWFAQFVEWLRRTANIRTAALMIAADGVKARLDAGLVAVGAISNRTVIDSVLYRADEPGELLAYWTATYGRNVPKPVKRGIADAVRRLYSGKSLLKYDTASKGYRFGDILNLVHAAPDPEKPWQGELFQYALDRRHHPDSAVPPESNRTLTAHRKLMALPVESRRALVHSDASAELLAEAGMTWESLAGWLQGPMDKTAWESVIPSMGYMALLRNLRNFDESGVSNKVANEVIVKLAQGEEVAKSRQLPFRFYAAYLNAPSLRWAHALETALDLCLPNIPTFSGRTLVLIDTSASMENPMSGKSSMSCVQAAALFGAAVTLKSPDSVELHHFASWVERIPVQKGGSVLKLTEQIQRMIGRVGHGTEMADAISRTYQGHDRVILFSDMQAFGGWQSQRVASGVPGDVPVYAFNLAGYSASPMPTGEAARFDLGGLSDQTFKLIPLLEMGTGAWPWETTAA